MTMLQRIRRGLSLRTIDPQDVDVGETVLVPIEEIEPVDDRTSYGDEGMSTVEYAVGTVAAAAFAAVLYRIVTGDSVISGLTNLVNSALNTSF